MRAFLIWCACVLIYVDARESSRYIGMSSLPTLCGKYDYLLLKLKIIFKIVVVSFRLVYLRSMQLYVVVFVIVILLSRAVFIMSQNDAEYLL